MGEFDDNLLASIAEIEMDVQSDAIVETYEYYIGCFDRATAPNQSAAAIGRYIAGKLGIVYGDNAVLLKNADNKNSLHVYLSGKAIAECIRTDSTTAQSVKQTFLDDLCNQINLIMVEFSESLNKFNVQQKQALKELRASYDQGTRATDESLFFIGRIRVDQPELKQRIHSALNDARSTNPDPSFWGTDQSKSDDLKMDTIKSYIAEKIGFGLNADDIEVQNAEDIRLVKVQLKGRAIDKCAQFAEHNQPGDQLKI